VAGISKGEHFGLIFAAPPEGGHLLDVQGASGGK
jgi:hypothetical protein